MHVNINEDIAAGYGDDMVDIQFHDEESSLDGWTGPPGGLA